MSSSGNRDEELDNFELVLEETPSGGYPHFDEEGPRPEDHSSQSSSAERSRARLRLFSALLRRRKGVLMAVLIAAVFFSAAYVLYRPLVFRSEAVLEVRDRPDRGARTSRGTARTESASRGRVIATEVGVLRGAGVAQSLVDRLTPRTAAQLSDYDRNMWEALLNGPLHAVTAWWRDSPAPANKASRSRLVEQIRNRISVHEEPGSRLLRIAFEADSPVMAQKVLQTYVAIYLERHADSWPQPAGRTGKVLEEEMRKAEDRLSQSRAALREFESKHDVKVLDRSSAEVTQRIDAMLADLIESVGQAPQDESSFPKAQSTEAPSQAASKSLRSLRHQLSVLESRYRKISGLYAGTFPPVESMKKQIEELRKKIEQTEQKTHQPSVQPGPKSAGSHVAEVVSAIKALVADQASITQYALLKQEVKSQEELCRRLAHNAAAAEPVQHGRYDGVVLVDKPTLPTVPIGMSSTLIVLMAAFLGLFGGLFAAVLVDRLDGRLYATEDIDASLGIRVLGAVPDVGKLKRIYGAEGEVRPYEFVAAEMPGTPVSDAIKNVKTSLGLSNKDFPIGSLVVSSAGPGEGKTFLAVSLATAIGSPERRILLVDSDLRHPRIGTLFGALYGQREGGSGLTTLISHDDVKLPDVLHRSAVPGMFYIAAGDLPPDPVALLESDRFQEVLRRLRRMFDLVIFDSPPLIGYPDARILAANTDGLVLAIQSARLPSQVIAQAVSTVAPAGGKILGAVLSKAEAVSSYYGNTYFKYGEYYEVGTDGS